MCCGLDSLGPESSEGPGPAGGRGWTQVPWQPTRTMAEVQRGGARKYKPSWPSPESWPPAAAELCDLGKLLNLSEADEGTTMLLMKAPSVVPAT